jgi:hypothetical protein
MQSRLHHPRRNRNICTCPISSYSCFCISTFQREPIETACVVVVAGGGDNCYEQRNNETLVVALHIIENEEEEDRLLLLPLFFRADPRLSMNE